MDDGAKKHLHDILEACRLIEKFVGNKTLNDYHSDSMLRSAVERQFQLIGEALQRMTREYPFAAKSISDHRTIINFRNILVHGYDMVDDEVVWGVIERSLPVLHREADSLLHAS
jgi:uncharacterized protein with HEPN domain